MPSPNTQSKVWWITGASSGIGKEIALELAAKGASIAVTARNREALEEVAKLCLSIGAPSCVVAPADLTQTESAKTCYQKIVSELGPVTVLISNAGTYLPSKVEDFSSEKAQLEMNLNYGGAVRCIEAVLPDMISKRCGHIVGVSSVAGFRGLPNSAGYGASKAALTHLLESLRLDLTEYKIDVTTVHPGFVKTPLTDKNAFPMPFLIEPSEAARKIVAGVEARKWEVHFPLKFTLIMKLLRILPAKLYSSIIRATTQEKS
jgi:short-subunit dehydrogenase